MDIIAAIDAATGCQQCGGPLGNSPSSDFCSEAHQYAWHARIEAPLIPRTGNLRFDSLAAALAFATARTPERRVAAETRLEEVRADLASAFAAIAQALEPAIQAAGDAFRALGEALVPLTERWNSLPLDDPRERALWLRQHRNTGPTRQHRPPRTINARRSR